MIRRDYILRIIEEFIGAIQRVLNLTDSGQYEAAHEEIEVALRELIHLDPDEALRIGEQKLLSRIQILSANEDWHARALVVATMLAAEGDIRRSGRDADAGYPFYLRALHLALIGWPHAQPDWPDALLSVEYAMSKLDDYLLPLPTQQALLDYYRAQGNLAKAEDLLFTWLAEQPRNAQLRECGVEFYQSLLTEADEKLEAEGLPRAEVEDGLVEMQSQDDSS